MEKKTSKKSIDKLIYSLMAAMLALVVIVSVFTVSFRRSESVDTSRDTSMTDTTDTSKNPSDTSSRTDHSKDTSSIKDSAPLPSDTTNKPTPADTDNTPTVGDVRYFVMPVVGSVSKEFEIDVPAYSLTMNDYRAHTGVDVSANLGSEVIAASDGTVCKIWTDPLMGRCVTIDHGEGIYTTYMNLANELDGALEVGAKVSMGQVLGAVGESAMIEIAEEPHLHLEMKVDGKYVDPLEYMGVSSEQDLEYEG